MARFVDKHWAPAVSGLTRRDREGCAYRAYVPDPLADRAVVLDGDVAADVADAEAAILQLNLQPSSLASTEMIARILLRAEAVASSRIEGLAVGPRRLLRAEAAREFHTAGIHDVTAREVLGSVDAMSRAMAVADSDEPVTVDTILGIHEELLAATPLADHAGRMREVQNWIGGSGYNPCSAAYVPPPPEHVPDLMADLAAFCNADTLPAVAQAAIAHAQFETIHPFVDGNGRAGRALIHLVLRRRGIAPRIVPPVSLVLATLTTDYIAGLTAFRHTGEPSSREASAGLNRWLGFFAGCCTRAVADSAEYERRIREVQRRWRVRLETVRRNSAVDLLVEALPGMSVVTIAGAMRPLGRSFNAIGNAMRTLEEAGVVRQITVGRRNRAFEATEIIDAFVDLERRLAHRAPGGSLTPSRRRASSR
ncbi:MAG: Fic family protein [Coriobacteriia bacterium]|nr:Fic family protein [Coriobacteriia bacterium]